MKQFHVRFWSNYDNLCLSSPRAWPSSTLADIIMLPRIRGGGESLLGQSETSLGDKMLKTPRALERSTWECGVKHYRLQTWFMGRIHPDTTVEIHRFYSLFFKCLHLRIHVMRTFMGARVHKIRHILKHSRIIKWMGNSDLTSVDLSR